MKNFYKTFLTCTGLFLIQILTMNHTFAVLIFNSGEGVLPKTTTENVKGTSDALPDPVLFYKFDTTGQYQFGDSPYRLADFSSGLPNFDNGKQMLYDCGINSDDPGLKFILGKENIGGVERNFIKANPQAGAGTGLDVNNSTIRSWLSPGAYGLSETVARTISFWLKLDNAVPTDIGIGAQLLTLGAPFWDKAGDGLSIYLNKLEGKRFLEVKYGSGADGLPKFFFRTEYNFSDGIWYHIALRTPLNGTLLTTEVLVNGIVVSTHSDPSLDVPVNISDKLFAWLVPWNNQGVSLADVRFYNQLLSNSQIIEIEKIPEYVPGTNASLVDLSINGTSLTGFTPAILNYEVLLPFGTSINPTVTYISAENTATVAVTNATNLSGTEAERTTTVLVTASDGVTQKIYKIVFTLIGPSINDIILTKDGNRFIALLAINRNDTLFQSMEIYADKIISDVISSMSPGNTLFIEAGEYPVENTIQLKSNITIAGEDTTTIIKKLTYGNLLVGNSIENISIKNLKLQSDHTEDGMAIFFAGKSINNLIDGVVINSFAGHGIFFQDFLCQYNTVKNSIIRDCSLGAGIALYNGSGNASIINNKIYRTQIHAIIFSAGASNCVVENNYVEASGYYRPKVTSGYFCHGIAIDGSGTRYGRNHIVQGNHIVNAGSAGIEIADWIDSVIIRDNIIEGTGIYAPFDQYGIYFGGSIKPGVYAEIVNNTVKNCKWSGIRADSNYGQGGLTKSVRIDSNIVINSTKEGILIGTVENASVNYNQISGSGYSGIVVKGYDHQLLLAKNITITNNTVSTSKQYGIDISYENNITITDNNFCGNTLAGLHKGNYVGSIILIQGNNCVTDFVDIPKNNNQLKRILRSADGSISISGLQTEEPVIVTVTDILGKIVFKKNFESVQEIPVILPDTHQVYIISVTTLQGRRILTEKIIK